VPYLVYLDETGDHGMDAIRNEFPVFGLVLLLAEYEAYCTIIVPAIYRLKLDFFGYEGVILHSRDIRRQQGPYSFLVDAKYRAAFYQRINAIMGTMPYQIIATIIHKDRHKERGRRVDNPYTLALTFALERLLVFLEEVGQNEVRIVAEARGKNEDEALRLSFLKTVRDGTTTIGLERFGRIRFELDFIAKERNLVGTQMADLVAYPLARYVLDPARANLAYEVFKEKIYRGRTGLAGLLIDPT
jgi:hypothetical protein